MRFGVAGRVKDDAVHWPITLRDLSEALGLAEQIIADAMEEFRSRGWIRQEGETLTIRDFDSLKLLAEFDPLYLHLEHPRGPAGRFSEVDWVKPLWGGGSEAVP